MPTPRRCNSIAPIAKLDFSPEPWLDTLQEASGLYKSDPQVQSLNASLRFSVTNRYFVSSEGSVIRTADSFYQVFIGATPRPRTACVSTARMAIKSGK